MKKYKRLEEKKDLNELIGELKGKYKSIAEVKKCKDFKDLSQADKEYVLDELKADGFNESVIKDDQIDWKAGNVISAIFEGDRQEFIKYGFGFKHVIRVDAVTSGYKYEIIITNPESNWKYPGMTQDKEVLLNKVCKKIIKKLKSLFSENYTVCRPYSYREGYRKDTYIIGIEIF